MMTDWHVRVGYQLPAMTADGAVALTEADNEIRSLLHNSEHGTVTCTIDVDADNAPRAAALAQQLAGAALAAAGHHVPPPAYVEAMTGDWLADQVSLAPLGIVGIGDIARMHGCSRQRAAELAKQPGFPEPIDTVGTRRVYDRRQVEAWLDAYDPQPGRPRKQAG